MPAISKRLMPYCVVFQPSQGYDQKIMRCHNAFIKEDPMRKLYLALKERQRYASIGEANFRKLVQETAPRSCLIIIDSKLKFSIIAERRPSMLFRCMRPRIETRENR